MKRALRISLTAAALLHAGSPWALENNTGGNAAEFLRTGAGARAMALGEAYGPVAEGPEAIYWNPAGLAQARGPEVSYSRSELLRFFHHDFLAYAQPVGFLKGTLAASWTRFSQDSLPVVTNANIRLGSFSPQSHAFALAYARSFDLEPLAGRDYFREAWNIPGARRPLRLERDPWRGTLLLGLSAKYVSETLHRRSARAFALDGGALFRPSDSPALSLSFTFRNLGSRERFIRESQSLPVEMDLGLAYDRRTWSSRLLPVLELSFPYFGNPYGKLGLEYARSVGQGLGAALRAGYKTQSVPDLGPLTGLTAGVGLRAGRLSLDLAFQPLAELGEVYRATLGFGW